MRYVAVAESDIGTSREVNQDSVLIEHAKYGDTVVLMAIVCDGMGGLSKGELASASVIHEFKEWFFKSLPQELKNIDINVIGGKFSLLLKNLNNRIMKYGQDIGERLGTTFTGILFVDNQFVIVHVGDTRVYHINKSLIQLTDDQTFIAKEILRGALTPEQAKTDKRRNMLLQCIGASNTVEPQIVCGETKPGFYLICSDGFRHKITEDELALSLDFHHLTNKRKMLARSKKLIDLVKQRGERDNISVILIRFSKELNAVKWVNRLRNYFIERKLFLLSIISLTGSVILLIAGFLVTWAV